MTTPQHPDDPHHDSPEPPREEPLTAFWGEPISVYTRQQAIEDGVLVDLTTWASAGPDGMLGGFTVPVAITRALWAVIDIESDSCAPGARRVRALGESTRGRAHDVLWMTELVARRSPHVDRLQFPVLMTIEGTGGRLGRRRLQIESRVDADGVTIGFPEDF